MCIINLDHKILLHMYIPLDRSFISAIAVFVISSIDSSCLMISVLYFLLESRLWVSAFVPPFSGSAYPFLVLADISGFFCLRMVSRKRLMCNAGWRPATPPVGRGVS